MPTNLKRIKKDEIDYKDISWKVIESYFQGQHLERLVRHQIESYNNFINYQIKKTIEMFNSVTIHSEHDKDLETGLYSLEMIITFDNFQIYRPQIHENNGATKIMFPQEARLRNFTYASNMVVDLKIEYRIYRGETLSEETKIIKVLPKVHIGKMPIMLKSKICILNTFLFVSQAPEGPWR